MPSPTTSLLTKQQYAKLLADLRRIIGEGKEQAERAAAQALLESYWSIGRRIAKEKLNTRAGYHNAILADLSADLGIDLRTLQRTVTFYQTYKRPPRIEGLSWAHYRILMQLQDASERSFYEELALTDGLSAQRLRTAIQGRRYESAAHQKPGSAVTLPRPTDPSYLYKAEVRDVVDADTLMLDIDLGFEVIRRQSIRLARIDAPPATPHKAPPAAASSASNSRSPAPSSSTRTNTTSTAATSPTSSTPSTTRASSARS